MKPKHISFRGRLLGLGVGHYVGLLSREWAKENHCLGASQEGNMVSLVRCKSWAQI